MPPNRARGGSPIASVLHHTHAPSHRRLFVVILVLALGASACTATTSGTTINFAIAVDDHELQNMQRLMSRFEAQNGGGVDASLPSRFRDDRGIRVNLVSMRPDDLPRRLSEGAPTIHLFAQDNVSLLPLVEGGLVQDLSTVDIDVPDKVLRAMVPPTFKGKTLFLPFRPNVRLTYANHFALTFAGVRAPKTVEELTPVAQKLRASHHKPRLTLSLSQEDAGATAVTISEMILAHDGDPRRLDDPGSIRAFRHLRELWSQGLLARESLSAKYDTEVENLRDGPSFLAQNWSVTSAELGRDLERFEVYDGWQGGKAHVIGGDVLGIANGLRGRELTATLELARFLMSQQAQEFLVQENSWPAIRDDAYGLVENTPTLAAIRKALTNGWFRPNERYWTDVTKAMTEAVDRIVLDGEPERPVLHELHARVAADNPLEYPPRR